MNPQSSDELAQEAEIKRIEEAEFRLKEEHIDSCNGCALCEI